MKKLSKILLTFLSVNGALFFTSCDKSKKGDNRTLLSYGDIHTSGVLDNELITAAALKSKIVDDKESLLVAISSDNCGCWGDFKPLINNYVKEHHLICYHQTYNQFKNYLDELKIDFVPGHVTLAIMENGVAKNCIIHDYDKKETTQQDDFNNLMNDLVRMPKCYYINEDDYKTMKQSDKTELVYFARSGCGDCSYLNRSILRDYVREKEFEQKIYILDCEKYWKSKDNEEEYKAYLDKKTEFGMSTESNPKFGFESGVFPFFSLIENGQYKSGAVAYNDTVEDEDGMKKITNSYYSSERVQNLSYECSVLVGNKYQVWDKITSTEVYRPLIYSFLDYALPQVTYTL